MNDRIQELLAQSTYEVMGVKQVDQKKFAELIVQECALTIQDFVDHRFPASEYPDRLKKYFGVKNA